MPNTSLTERLSRQGRVTELTRVSSAPPEEVRLTAMMIFNALTAELAAAGPTRRASPKP